LTPSTGAFASGTTSKAAVNGLATFDDLVYPHIGTITVRASADGLSDTPASNPIAVTEPTTAKYTLSAPADITAGGARAAYTVSRYDAFGNAVTGGAET